MTTYERTYLERLKLASDVILTHLAEEAPDDGLYDVLKVDLASFRERIEHSLLQ